VWGNNTCPKIEYSDKAYQLGKNSHNLAISRQTFLATQGIQQQIFQSI
jgi:hypothetical protein